MKIAQKVLLVLMVSGAVSCNGMLGDMAQSIASMQNTLDLMVLMQLRPLPELSLEYDGHAVGAGELIDMGLALESAEKTITLTITNIGTVDLPLSVLELRGGYAGYFTIDNLTAAALPATLGPDEAVSFDVTFASNEKNSGYMAAVVSISTGDEYSPYNVTVACERVERHQANMSIWCGNTWLPDGATYSMGTTTAAVEKTFTVYNTGTTAMTIDAIGLDDATDFAISGLSAGDSIAAGGSVAMTVSFTPAFAGSHDASATFAYSYDDGVDSVSREHILNLTGKASGVVNTPGAPTLMSGDQKLTVTWTAMYGASSYEVWFSTANDTSSAWHISGITGTSRTISGLTNGTTYYVWLKSKSEDVISGFGPVASGVPKPVPNAPGAATIVPGDAQLFLKWAAVTWASSYEVWYGVDSDSSKAVRFTGDGDDTDVTCTVTGIAAGTTYYVWIKAKNDAGTSGFGTISSGLTYCSVTYASTDHTIGSVPAAAAYKYGATITVLGNTGDLAGAEIRDGIRQRLLRWNTSQDGIGTDYVEDDTFVITANVTLYAIYSTGSDVIRKVGPAGGWVFYDAGSVQSWGRYLEAANEDLTESVWGTYDTSVGTSVEIGTGMANTEATVLKDTATANKGADRCYNYSVLYNGTTYDDWFLPSKNELIYVYSNLKCSNVADFNNHTYQSSSEYDSGYAWMQEFSGDYAGMKYHSQKNYFTYGVRPVRYFQ